MYLLTVAVSDSTTVEVVVECLTNEGSTDSRLPSSNPELMCELWEDDFGSPNEDDEDWVLYGGLDAAVMFNCFADNYKQNNIKQPLQ